MLYAMPFKCGLILQLLILGFGFGAGGDVIRRTQYGLVSGELKSSKVNENVQYYSFLAVPYASPPVGNLRFRAPVKHQSWEGVRSVTTPPSSCVFLDQNFITDEVFGSEDCLYLEISEPITARNGSKELLPVLVWIHGGTFVFGSKNVTGPDYMMEKPVILITLQYRLNVFGFLSTMDENASGNFGLKDQQFALKWIQKNVENFGGDPNRVTISGGSAGAASVLFHCLSPKSQGLFHRAISVSGTPLNRWVLQKNPLKKVRRLAKGLGIKSKDANKMVEGLREINYVTLMQAVYNESVMGKTIPYYVHPFAPSIEADGPTSFITERAFKLLEEGRFAQVPHLMGHTTEEGSFPYEYVDLGAVNLRLYAKSPETIIPSSMNIPHDSSCVKDTLDDIKEFYFKDNPLTDPFNWTNYMSQDLFNRGIVKTAQFLVKKTDVYYYIMSYAGSRPMSYFGGVGHYEDTLYLFYPRRKWSNVETPLDTVIRKRLVTLWTNFAATGNPTPRSDPLLYNVIWPKFDERESFLDMNTEFSIRRRPEKRDRDFWERVFKKCGFEPYYTY